MIQAAGAAGGCVAVLVSGARGSERAAVTFEWSVMRRRTRSTTGGPTPPIAVFTDPRHRVYAAPAARILPVRGRRRDRADRRRTSSSRPTATTAPAAGREPGRRGPQRHAASTPRSGSWRPTAVRWRSNDSAHRLHRCRTQRRQDTFRHRRHARRRPRASPRSCTSHAAGRRVRGATDQATVTLLDPAPERLARRPRRPT